uniref:Uncharacterized protein n=1 Tax=Candidatus Kentrum sp. SD TaxID=2126332 RepID=A0A450YB72_9GAMM|nr:MAG: hypothetical protein BECKSD772F_GA0070984_10282 [Candidatus Kentron sp. SD]VFK43544.1 MAG: hypothetical protein BECKSD772E_GA0070983_10272 [Candidatus Kentron sp. SD]
MNPSSMPTPPTEALGKIPTLVILDNLEAVSKEALRELLDAAAHWSRSGGSRVLLTSRIPDFEHPDYGVQGTREHRRIELRGLDSGGALDWFAALFKLPPEPHIPTPGREELMDLFHRVGFHPLSIAVLTQQLKTRLAPELGERLRKILRQGAVSTIADQGADQGASPGLIASLELSLELSLECFSEAERHAARRLGVFQGGALESELLAITGLGGNEGERKQLETRLAALEGDDPCALLRAMGREIPDGAEPSAEQLAELPGKPEHNAPTGQLVASLGTEVKFSSSWKPSEKAILRSSGFSRKTGNGSYRATARTSPFPPPTTFGRS